LDPVTINNAFAALEDHDAVIGPAMDGGYYLIGMNRKNKQLFTNKNWSTATVFHDTIDDFEESHMKYWVLPKLRDVDTEDDLITLEAVNNNH
jgi:hypothetical protein